MNVSNIPFGANNWQYRIYLTHESNLCGAASATDSAVLKVFAAENDFLVTLINKLTNGDVSTNDSVPVGTIYGPPTPVVGNPSACVPSMLNNGSYTFCFSIAICRTEMQHILFIFTQAT